jgi:hypothetical protein
MNRKARDRKIAEEIADELAKALGSTVTPEALAGRDDIVCAAFERVFDAHGIVNEFAGANVLKCVPKILARRQLDAQRK